ncbi:sensor histidine kinase [Altererythrobacter lutimaris]|uniref:histidine kinase n=1 Tax=Altererythrobacter lutimaris TaxID=2743979 RepID=A0A850HDJ1_9SPHN|nr:PAS domain-containing protein [Altererythrobacter lutimaris]NVE95181.1 PAS domain-containing protein [Altererythrobacter lutimaris]
MTFDAHKPWPKGADPDAALCGENERLRVISGFGLDDFAADEELNRITRFAAHLCKAPMATVSLVEEARQRFLAREGLNDTETPRSTSFCAHTMLGGQLMEVLDASHDDRFDGFATVTGDMHLRYYIGAPLISEEGAPLGALCVFDREPRSEPLGALEREGLEVLASAVMRFLQSRREGIAAETAIAESEARFRMLADSIPDIAWSTDPDGRFDYFNARWYEFIGVDARPEDGWDQYFHPQDHARWHSTWETARETGEAYETEYRLKHADGNYRWVLTRGLPVRDGKGEIVRWFGTITDIDDTYRESEARDLLARELAHRIKNVFSIISSLLTLRTRGKPELAEFSQEMDQAIRALAQAQDFVMPVRPQDEQQLLGLLEILLAPYSKTRPDAVKLSGASIQIGPRSATPLALVIHELGTNATKYGALSAPDGSVSVHVEEQGDLLMLTWKETGGPEVSEPSSEGFGTRLLKTTIENQLGGKFTRDWDPSGFSCTITVSKAHLQE